jgi:hypothetical protein
MTKHLLYVFASLFLVAGSVHAQSVALRTDIPFDFVVDNTIMPVGTYTIQPLSPDESNVELLSPELKHGILLAPCTAPQILDNMKANSCFKSSMANISSGRFGRRATT